MSFGFVRRWRDARDLEQAAAEFEFYRVKADMPNAIATYDRVADGILANLEQTQPIARELRSIVSSFMPKSGGTFLYNRLVHDCRYVEYHWGVANPNAAQAVYAAPRALRNYLLGGCASHTHFLPTPHNLMAFEAAGVDRVWVHVRHPCEVVQASYYHYAGQGQGEGSIARARIAENSEEAERYGLDVDAADARKLNAFFREQLPWVVDWLRMWILRAEVDPDFVYFTSHRQLDDPRAFLSRVFAAFGVPIANPSIAEHHAEDRRRAGHSADWRDRLDAETIGEAVALLERRLAPPRWVRELIGIDG